MNFKSIINDACCDNRIKDGIIRLDNPKHVFVLQEYLEKAGYSLEEVINKTAVLFESHSFPEQQAYNKDGILVTFPNKECKEIAINNKTHFLKNPKIDESKIFLNEGAEEIEEAIVNALYDQGYPKDKNVEFVAKKVADSIRPVIGDIKNAQAVGRKSAQLTDFWKTYEATDTTPKTDIIINNFKSSVKYGPSQLMSGGKNETIATFMAAVNATPNLEKKIIDDVLKMLENFVASTRTIQGGVEDLLKQQKLKKSEKETKSALEKKVEEIAKNGDKAHKELKNYLDTVFTTNPHFKSEFIKEAMTGDQKFGENSYASANYILSVSKSGESVFFNSINDDVINSVTQSTRISVRFKSASVKLKGKKTGQYRFWSVLSLITKGYSVKMEEINNVLSNNIITENILDTIKKLLSDISEFVSNLFFKIKEYILKGLNSVLNFFDLDLQEDLIVVVNDQLPGGKIILDFSKVLQDNTK